MQSISINVTKIDKTAIIAGKNGKYLSLTLFENKDGPDKYGNDGFVTQDLGKERREAGERGEILGNWKHVGRKAAAPAPPRQEPQPTPDDDDVPF
jgi:hypothetical protein